MSSRRKEKLGKPDFDFDDDGDCSLDQILDSITSQIKSSDTSDEKSYSKDNRKKSYQHKIAETLEDILNIEKNARESVLDNIEELYSGNKVREYAERYYISEPEAREEIRNILISQLKSWKLRCIDKQHYPLPREIKHIIRMDFYGTVKEPDTKKLSDTYRKRNPENTQKLTPKDYDLTRSPSWMVFRQFKSFRLLEKIVVANLIEAGITPDQAKRLNPYDYSDVLFKHFVKKRRREGVEAHNASIFLGARQRFIKKFIRTHEAAFRNYMKMTGVDERYTEVLVHNMRTKGLTGNVEVIDKTFNEKQIKLFQSRKLIPATTKAGDRITETNIRKIREAGLINEILTKNDKGEIITGPALSVHHKVAVKDCGEKTNFSEVNLFKNLCLMVEPYHDIAHSLDKTRENNGGESYVSRIELDEDVIFYGGFNKIFQIYQHFDVTEKINSDEAVLRNYQESHKVFETESDLPKKKSSIRKEKKFQKNVQRRVEKMAKQEQYANSENNTPSKSKAKKQKTEKPNNKPNSLKDKCIEKLKKQQKPKNILAQRKQELIALRTAQRAAAAAAKEAKAQAKTRAEADKKQRIGNIMASILSYKQRQ